MGETLLKGTGLTKRYGGTVAVNGVSFSLERGETLGLIGSNGAGKSTLMRLISGVARPDEGAIAIDGVEQSPDAYGAARAAELGIKVVYQELSLFSNLTVYENLYIEQAAELSGVNWRARARKKAAQALQEIFPGCAIRPEASVGDLSIAQRQMVEIARAASGSNLRLLILDEPTSSMGSVETEQFMRHLALLAKRGVAIIYISHRLDEVTALADSILILQNGAVKWRGEGRGVDKDSLIQRMADAGDGTTLPVLRESAAAAKPVAAGRSGRITLRGFRSERLRDITADLEGGRIYGIAGLEGNGQKYLLRALFEEKGGAGAAITREGRIAYVSGDRKKEGVFLLWNLLDNIRIGKLALAGGLSRLADRDDRREAREWYDRLQVRAEGLGAEIGSLSGGNQQKILIARAMFAKADIILLDDPTRGVDVGTKKMLYELFREAAAAGKLVVWHSTEDDEFAECDEVLVMRYGHIVKRLERSEISKDAIIAASFSGESLKREAETAAAKRDWSFGGVLLPFATMVLVYVLSGLMTPGVFSLFGVDLLIGGAIPLALATVSQMYIIGFSHINMGVGALMGTINVLGATWLHQNTALGVGAILGACLLFTASGLLIRLRNIPAIVVTLGSSFVWTGISYTIQSHPGGEAPAWLVSLYNVQLPFLPTSVYWILLLIVVAWLVSGSRYGTVLKAAGNNPQALERSGWSMLVAIGVGYFISGLFCAFGGLALTAITTASDANSSASYTLLTVASVVMGGGELTGGKVNPAGAVFGAITLSLLGSLLGFMNVSSNYVTLVQGLILIAILGLRLLRRSANHGHA